MQDSGTRISQQAPARLTATQAAQLRALQNQKRVTAYPYYSTVTFYAFRQGDPPGPYNWGIARGAEARAFSYGKGQAMTNAVMSSVALAGYPIATPAETNLVKASETISGESVEIGGLSVMVKQYGMTDSEDPSQHYLCSGELLAALQTSVSVDISVNGDQNRFHLGVLSMLPGAGGLVGAGMHDNVQPSLGGVDNPTEFTNNGWATRSNYFRMPEGLIWRPKGQADSQLQLIFRAEREIAIYSGGSAANNVPNQGTDRPSDFVNGIQGYNFPNALEVVLLVHLHGRVVGPRTRSA
jgi:hypothetical protein